jgi:hypothetical protein
MAEYGEWGRKGATLSNVTAVEEYGITDELIDKGIRAGKLEYRHGAIWGNPYVRLLRSQLERYIAEEVGSDYLGRASAQTELRQLKKEIAQLRKRLSELQHRKGEIEAALEGKPPST